MWRLSRVILSVWVQVMSVSVSVVYFTDRAQSKTVLPIRHPLTLDVDFCCHTLWSSAPLYVLKLTASAFQTDSSGHSIELWYCHVTASARSALRTSGVYHSCVCGCLIVHDYKTGFSLSLSTAEIHFYCVEDASLKLGILNYLWLIPIQKSQTPAPKHTRKFKKDVVQLSGKRRHVTL